MIDTPILGAVVGDVVGSRFEFCNHRSKDFELFSNDCFFTDDTVMTFAVYEALLESGKEFSNLEQKVVEKMKFYGRKYPNRGYGCNFLLWIMSNKSCPYYSFGNGSAMRVSPVAYFAKDIEEAKRLSRIVTSVTHNHPEGIKGAEATTVAIFMALQGKTKQAIKKKIEEDYYKLDFTIDEIRGTYEFNETCQETVPQAIKAFLESSSFEDAIRTAISVGGDSDTLAAITGSVAEAYYGVPKKIQKEVLSFLPKEFDKMTKIPVDKKK